MPYPNYHSARIKSPDAFARIRVLQTLPNGILIYGGPLKTDPRGSGKPQAYRFPKTKFTVAEAKAWLKDHDITYTLFEPAGPAAEHTYERLTNIEIMATGDWVDSAGKITKYTNKDLDELADGTNEVLEYVKPRVRLGHEVEQKLANASGVPALGWIERLKRKGDKVLADIKDIPKVLAELIQKRVYKRVSSSIIFNYTEQALGGKKFRRILDHIAFVGGALPGVTTLQDIAALYEKETEGDIHTVEFTAKDGVIEMARGKGKGVGGNPQGDAGADTCKCPECGHEMAHKRAGEGKSIPCADIACPECGHKGMEGVSNMAQEGEREKNKKAQEARATKYGIDVKEGGNVTKPGQYSGLSDDQFGDPVNYRYPIDDEHILAAHNYFSKPENRTQYDKKEVGTIWTRIMRKAKASGISHTWNETLDTLLPADLKSWAKGKTKKLIQGGVNNMALEIIEQDDKRFVSVKDLEAAGIDIKDLPDVKKLTQDKVDAEKKVTDLEKISSEQATEVHKREVKEFITSVSNEKCMKVTPAEVDNLTAQLEAASTKKVHDYTLKDGTASKRSDWDIQKAAIEARPDLAGKGLFKEYSTTPKEGEEEGDSEGKERREKGQKVAREYVRKRGIKVKEDGSYDPDKPKG